MVRVVPKSLGGSSNSSISPRVFILVAALVVVVFVVVRGNDPYSDLDTSTMTDGIKSSSSSYTAKKTAPFNEEQNNKEMKEWRETTEAVCDAVQKNEFGAAGMEKKKEAEVESIAKIQKSDAPSEELPSGHRKYEYCRNTFIDLGTNIGDSIGYFVDNALDVCTPLWLKQNPKWKINQNFPRPTINVTTAKISHEGVPKANPMVGIVRKETLRADQTRAPSESFCVYGMEGNPAFTKRLQKLENFVMDMRPRPVRHLHIHTESVVTATDGPTKLFLDKLSVDQNFWGSSILSSQQDAQKSAKALGNGEVFAAKVDGISLSTLVKSTMLPYQPGATDDDKKGGLLIVKMDVEGAEYQVLKEIAETGLMCEYVKMGNRVVMIVEYHNMSITDAKERNREKAGSQDARKTLEACGVEFGKLHAFWA